MMSAQQFARLRRKLRLTQRQFGERLHFGSPQPRVSEIERGRIPVTPHVEALCHYLEQEALSSGYNHDDHGADQSIRA